MKAIKQGNVFTISNSSLEIYNQLPAQAYNVRFAEDRGFFLELSAPIEVKEAVYGVHNDKCDKVLDAFKAFTRNLGVILSGDKGIGKSLFAKMLAGRANDAGYPVLIVDTYIPGVAAYIQNIEQECVVMFDEFDKTFGDVEAQNGNASPQTGLLTLFDGMAMGKKMFVVTCNDLRKLSEFLVNRPGRFHYHFRFDYPTPEEIAEYMRDKLPEEFWGEIQPTIAFSRRVKLNYDCLRAIVFEISRGLPFKDAIGDLNILNLDKEKYSVELRFENGAVAFRRDCYIDMFADEEDYFWLADKRGYNYCRVTFAPSSAQWNEKILGNIIMPDAFQIEYCGYDDDEVELEELVESAKKSKPAYILIQKNYGRDLRYVV